MRLIVVCAAALAGIAAGDLARLDLVRLVVPALLAVLGAGLVWRRPRWRLAALAACAVALGAGRATSVGGSAADSAPPQVSRPIEPYLGTTVRVWGEVVQAPVLSASGQSQVLQLQAGSISPRAQPSSMPPVPLPGMRIRVVGPPVSPVGDLGVDDVVELQGWLVPDNGGRTPVIASPADRAATASAQSRAPPTLLFPVVLQHQPASTGNAPVRRLAALRASVEGGIRRYLPEPQASLATGVLLGGSGRLDARFRQQLQRSGLSHLVAIDGFKQVVVAGGLGAVAVRVVGPRLATLPVLLGVIGYTLLTGAHPSAVRAGLMVGLASLAALSGRVADPLTSLLLALVVMASLEPRILLDLGLQLSLSAVLGIILVWPRLRPLLHGVPRAVGEPVGLTVAVTLASLPVVLSVFQQVSLVSPIAHVLAIPLLPAVLLGAVLLASVSSVPPLGAAVAWLAWLPTTLLVQVVRVCGDLPGAALSTGRLPPIAALGLAGALLAWGLLGLPEAGRLRRKWLSAWGRNPRWTSAPMLCVAGSAAAAALLAVFRADGELHVTALDVGRGQAVFIRGPTGRAAVVVAGRIDPVLLTADMAAQLAVWEHKLDALVCLDPQAEALSGAATARYPPDARLNGTQAARFDLGGGAVIDIYPTEDQPAAGLALSFGNIWLPIAGHPPPPDDASIQRVVIPPASDLESDGLAIWAVGG